MFWLGEFSHSRTAHNMVIRISAASATAEIGKLKLNPLLGGGGKGESTSRSQDTRTRSHFHPLHSEWRQGEKTKFSALGR